MQINHPDGVPMQTHFDSAAALARLDRLEEYLQEDSDNETLLAEAFNTALQCAEWPRAEFHLRHGLALYPESLHWRLRDADFWLAQADFGQASIVLKTLQKLPGQQRSFTDAVLQNLAFIEFQSGRYSACAEVLAERLMADIAPAANVQRAPAEMALLWLRANHHENQLDRAIHWTQAFDREHGLSPQIAGVASLVALDAGDLELADRWSAMVLDPAFSTDRPIEALVTQASLALASTDAAKALSFSAQALRINPQDGRVLSAHAFAQLLGGQPSAALAYFQKAVSVMPNHIGTWHGQGWAQLVLHDLDAAHTSFEAALALDHNFAESHGALAVVLALQNQAEPANAHIQVAQRLDRGNLSGRFAQAILDGETADARAFEQMARRLLGGMPSALGDSLFERVMHASRHRK